MSAPSGNHARQSVGDPAFTLRSGERGYRKPHTGDGIVTHSRELSDVDQTDQRDGSLRETFSHKCASRQPPSQATTAPLPHCRLSPARASMNSSRPWPGSASRRRRRWKPPIKWKSCIGTSNQWSFVCASHLPFQAEEGRPKRASNLQVPAEVISTSELMRNPQSASGCPTSCSLKVPELASVDVTDARKRA